MNIAFLSANVPIAMLMVLPLQLGGKTQMAKELCEQVCQRLGVKSVSRESISNVENFVVRYGDEGVDAYRKLGPQAIQLAEEASAQAPDCVKLIARHGDQAIWIVSKPKRLAIFVKHGDDAATAMLKHGTIADNLISQLGGPAAGALKSVDSQNARRLAMLHEDGLFTASKQSTRLLEVVQNYGNAASNFIWRNKLALATSTCLIAFLNDPEPFINGSRELPLAVVRETLKPVTGAAGQRPILLYLVMLASVVLALKVIWPPLASAVSTLARKLERRTPF